MTEELITAINKKNGEDRSVSSADKLLTPGSDKAGNLDKAALLPAPDGVPLLEAGASASENRGIGECHVYKIVPGGDDPQKATMQEITAQDANLDTCNILGRLWDELYRQLAESKD